MRGKIVLLTRDNPPLTAVDRGHIRGRAFRPARRFRGESRFGDAEPSSVRVYDLGDALVVEPTTNLGVPRRHAPGQLTADKDKVERLKRERRRASRWTTWAPCGGRCTTRRSTSRSIPARPRRDEARDAPGRGRGARPSPACRPDPEAMESRSPGCPLGFTDAPSPPPAPHTEQRARRRRRRLPQGWVAVALDRAATSGLGTASFSRFSPRRHADRRRRPDRPARPRRHAQADAGARAFVGGAARAASSRRRPGGARGSAFAEANEIARTITGKGISQQAFALGGRSSRCTRSPRWTSA